MNPCLAPYAIVQPRRVPRSSIKPCPPRSYALVPTPTTQITMSLTEYEERCNTLRLDLKQWEKNFAAQNNGRKAGRDDIKADEEICKHAMHYAVAKCPLTYLSKQVQRVQQATSKASCPGRPSDPIKTRHKPSKYPRSPAPTKSNHNAAQEETGGRARDGGHTTITGLSVASRTQRHWADPAA